MISALILTYNEAVNVGDCIASLPWREDVQVLDSNSIDETRNIAEACGATVHVRPFTNYADQRNFGLGLSFKNRWVVMLDADERMTPQLAAEIEGAIFDCPDAVVMFRVRRQDIFLGRWLRHASGYPTWFPRLIRKGKVHVEREVNEEYVANGQTQMLTGHLLHFPFNKGPEWWFDRHNRYSTLEAEVLGREIGKRSIALSDMLSPDPGKRRVALKQLAYRLPGRPFLVFLYLYFVRLGFLDGRAGFHFSSMRMAYEIMIDSKIATRRSATPFERR